MTLFTFGKCCMLWSVQNEIRRICFVVAGVSPYLVELDLINEVQNPVFAIVKPIMLTGVSLDDLSTMIRRIGRQMGLDFDDKAIAYIYSHYGGHPLLSRLACSFTNKRIIERGLSHPANVDVTMLRNAEQERDSELQFYCRHIVSELEMFYKEEYETLELLARGGTADFVELSFEPQWVMHLKGYGIVETDKRGKPTIKLPVLKKYVAAEAARKSGQYELRSVVAPAKRESWLTRRKDTILTDIKTLLRIVSKKPTLFQLYNGPFLPEADRFMSIELVTDWPSFGVFINKTNQTFCETIDDIPIAPRRFSGNLKTIFLSYFMRSIALEFIETMQITLF